MRRIYTERGSSMLLWVWRALSIPAITLILPWAFASVLAREIGRAFWHASVEARDEWAEFCRLWHGGRLS